MMSFLRFYFVAVLFVLTACASGASNDNQVASESSEPTAKAAVTVVQKIVVVPGATQTPRPTRTLLPTFTPLPYLPPEPPPIMPDGWARYTLLPGNVSFSYPSDWLILDERENLVRFLRPMADSQQLILYFEESSPLQGYDNEVHYAQQLFLAMANPIEWDFLEEGKLDIPSERAYISATTKMKSWDGTDTILESGFVASFAVNKSESMTIVLRNVRRPEIPDDAKELVKQVLESVEFHDPK